MTNSYSHGALWALAAPMILSNLSIPLVGITDAAVMGHLGQPEYLAAVGAGAQIFGVIFMGLNFLRMGTTGLAAQSYGQESSTQLRNVLVQSCCIGLALGVLLILLQRPILAGALSLLKPSDTLGTIIGEYYQVRIWSAPVTLVNFVVIGWLLGLQNAKGALWVLLSITITNIVLDIFFVNGLGYTADGVALASVIAEFAGLVCGGVLCLRSLNHYPGSWRLSEVLD
ncbi:MAG: MATE family efflux transporter, partial [Pseudomonadota bacterium]